MTEDEKYIFYNALNGKIRGAVLDLDGIYSEMIKEVCVKYHTNFNRIKDDSIDFAYAVNPTEKEIDRIYKKLKWAGDFIVCGKISRREFAIVSNNILCGNYPIHGHYKKQW